MPDVSARHWECNQSQETIKYIEREREKERERERN
jgi:hypothetical protein